MSSSSSALFEPQSSMASSLAVIMQKLSCSPAGLWQLISYVEGTHARILATEAANQGVINDWFYTLAFALQRDDHRITPENICAIHRVLYRNRRVSDPGVLRREPVHTLPLDSSLANHLLTTKPSAAWSRMHTEILAKVRVGNDTVSLYLPVTPSLFQSLMKTFAASMGGARTTSKKFEAIRNLMAYLDILAPVNNDLFSCYGILFYQQLAAHKLLLRDVLPLTDMIACLSTEQQAILVNWSATTTSPLHDACLAEVLRQHPHAVNARDRQGNTPLINACFYNNETAVARLLTCDGILPELRSRQGFRASDWCHQRGYNELLKRLPEHPYPEFQPLTCQPFDRQPLSMEQAFCLHWLNGRQAHSRDPLWHAQRFVALSILGNRIRFWPHYLNNSIQALLQVRNHFDFTYQPDEWSTVNRFHHLARLCQVPEIVNALFQACAFVHQTDPHGHLEKIRNKEPTDVAPHDWRSLVNLFLSRGRIDDLLQRVRRHDWLMMVFDELIARRFGPLFETVFTEQLLGESHAPRLHSFLLHIRDRKLVDGVVQILRVLNRNKAVVHADKDRVYRRLLQTNAEGMSAAINQQQTVAFGHYFKWLDVDTIVLMTRLVFNELRIEHRRRFLLELMHGDEHGQQALSRMLKYSDILKHQLAGVLCSMPEQVCKIKRYLDDADFINFIEDALHPEMMQMEENELLLLLCHIIPDWHGTNLDWYQRAYRPFDSSGNLGLVWMKAALQTHDHINGTETHPHFYTYLFHQFLHLKNDTHTPYQTLLPNWLNVLFCLNTQGVITFSLLMQSLEPISRHNEALLFQTLLDSGSKPLRNLLGAQQPDDKINLLLQILTWLHRYRKDWFDAADNDHHNSFFAPVDRATIRIQDLFAELSEHEQELLRDRFSGLKPACQDWIQRTPALREIFAARARCVLDDM